MFSRIGTFLAKISLSTIIKNLKLDVDTVKRKTGYYLRVIVEVFSIKIIDEDILLSEKAEFDEKQKKKVLKLSDPIDVIRTNQLDPFGNLNDIAKNRTNK